MVCYAPLTAYYSKAVNPTGRRSLVFDVRKSHDGFPIKVPCGQCIGCRLARARSWAVRCMHEVRCFDVSSFVTLTYADCSLPTAGTLVKRDLQLFMKRLRKVRPVGLRFFACGEYGERTFRPHYHLLLFNTDFADKRFYKTSSTGFDLFKSDELRGLWPAGDNIIGGVTFESAAYVARYCLKKITGPEAEAHYAGREREFTVMSRRPGIGLSFFEKHGPEMYRHDSAIMSGREVALPRYYDTKFEAVDSVEYDRVKVDRRLRSQDHMEDQTLRRLRVREEFEERKSKLFVRET
ncbi:MAG: replication initiator protein [Microviridae sp.]|nr:MAG: replication initiator protein [Microviridae sp.]